MNGETGGVRSSDPCEKKQLENGKESYSATCTNAFS